MARYLFDAPMSRETCAEAVQARIRQVSLYEQDDRITLALERREDAAMIGEITLIWRSVTDRQGEVGYILNPAFHGQGYATEAVEALISVGFTDLALHRIYARCNPANAPSFRLMERLGMRREAHLRQHRMVKGAWDEEYIYAILAADWPSG